MNILDLPDDILEAIVDTWEPRPYDYFGDWPGQAPQLFLRPLLMLGSVCRRWRIRVFPYLFRQIYVIDTARTQPHHLPAFLIAHKTIACVVQSLIFSHNALDCHTLYALSGTQLLPALTRVVFDFAGVVPSALLTVPRNLPLHVPMVGQGLLVQDLVIHTSSNSELVRDALRASAVVLGCYNRIGNLKLLGGSDWTAPRDFTLADDNSGGNDLSNLRFPIIEDIDVGPAAPNLLCLLKQWTTPPHITCLDIASDHSTSLQDINMILCMISDTLVHLNLRISWNWDPHPASLDSDEIKPGESTRLIFCATQRMQYLSVSICLVDMESNNFSCKSKLTYLYFTFNL